MAAGQLPLNAALAASVGAMSRKQTFAIVCYRPKADDRSCRENCTMRTNDNQERAGQRGFPFSTRFIERWGGLNKDHMDLLSANR